MNAARTNGFDKGRGFVVRMRGLPFNGSSSDVLRFFEGIDVVRGMEGVVFTYAQVRDTWHWGAPVLIDQPLKMRLCFNCLVGCMAWQHAET